MEQKQTSANQVYHFLITTLLSVIAFFAVMFYKKVEQIAEDMTVIKLSTAVTSEQIKGLERRVTVLEETLKAKP